MEKFIVSWFVVALLALIGCSSSEPESTDTPVPPAETPTPEGFVDLDCGSSETGKTFEDWASWTKVNPAPIRGHDNPYVIVYVDDMAKATYLAASSPYPECARILKVNYKDEAATEVVDMTIMVKMPAGYDPENNDWWYGDYADDTRAWASGKLWSDCIECHRKAADTDYLFSEEVLAASRE